MLQSSKDMDEIYDCGKKTKNKKRANSVKREKRSEKNKLTQCTDYLLYLYYYIDVNYYFG